MSLRALFLVMVVCLVGAPACSHAAPIRNPDPIAAAPSPEASEMAILEALPKRRWTAEEVTPGRIVAFLPVKGYLVRAEIVYDARQVQIRYLSSDNLGERRGDDGEIYAHANVNKWLRTLAVTIARALGTAVPVALGEASEPEPSAGGEAEIAAPPLLGSALGGEDDNKAASAPAQGESGPLAPVPVAPR